MSNTNWNAKGDTALVIVDVQNDFCPDGNLAVPAGDEIVPVINGLRDHFQTVVQTQDWHPAGHSSFASTHGMEPFNQKTMPYGDQTLWPDHCVQGTEGAKFHPDLVVGKDDLILQKGDNQDIDSYSAFFENDGKTQPKFANGKTFTQSMKERGVKTLVFTGLAQEICVAWNAKDAVKQGFNAVVVLDASQPLDSEAAKAVLADLRKAGVKTVTSAELPKALNL